MLLDKIDYSHVSQLSKRDRDYLEERREILDFITAFPSLDSIYKQVNNKKNHPVNRNLLYRKLVDQYRSFDDKNFVSQQISSLLDENCFTVVTAHQPSLFTGPLYFIFKILSVITLSRRLNEKYEDIKVVPVFILGAEDHDFDEINHVNLYSSKLYWDRNSSGPVGRLSLDGLGDVFNEFRALIGPNNNIEGILNDMANYLETSKNYGQFTQKLVHKLFGQYGLVTLSMDDPDLKKSFSSTIKKELTESTSYATVIPTQKRLAALDYPAQAYVRPINLFYMKDDFRSRIEKEGDYYLVVGQDIKISEEQILEELEKHPERFSPNVILRPVYQESILPNLAYVGGGGELAYWVERKDQFKSFEVPFPILVRRNSAMLLRAAPLKKLQKNNISLEEVFKDDRMLIKSILKKAGDHDEYNYKIESEAIKKIFSDLSIKIKEVDPTLEKYVLAESAKAIKSIDQISKKAEKRIKEQHELSIKQVVGARQKLFPSNGLQERHDNIFSYLSSFGLELIDIMLPHMNPLDKNFLVFKID